MNYPCAMSLLCLMEPPIVLTHLQDQLGNGKCLTGDVSSWPVAANFKSISNPQFVQLPESVVNDLSTDQHYAYKICSAIIMGVVDSDLQ